MRKGEEQDTELGMLTHKWNKLKVVLFCFSSDLAYILALWENSHVWLGQTKKAKLCYSLLNKALTGQKDTRSKSIFEKGMEMGIKSIKVNKIELLRSYFISAVSQYMQEKIKTNICPGNESQFTNKYYSARMGNS